jgi:hypothetical protein
VPSKPLEKDIETMVDQRVSEILDAEGPTAELSLEKIMLAFEGWVLPDHHLDVIRQRLGYWIQKKKK